MQAGHTIADVANVIGCHRSTLYRERRRNGGSSADINAYQPALAHARANQRARQANAHPRIETWVYCQAYDFLENCDLSPARIADQLPVSHEWVYQWIYRHIAAGFGWEQHLRGGRSKRQTRRCRLSAAKTGTSAARPIAERPVACNLRLEFGHWEADLLLGRKDNTYAVLVVKERTSRLTLLARVRSQQSHVVMRAMTALLRPYRGQVKTMTTDNGKEFFHHQTFVQTYACVMYRCDPHSPWQRGQVEGENKNLRQYMPKSFDADRLTTKRVKDVERRINVRPKLVLNNDSPIEVAERLSGVALRY
jgi:IS30 family transposase